MLANARVAQFDGDAISFVNLHLALRDGRIAELIPASQTIPPASDSTDLTGTFVYPGLVDAHAHFMALGQALETVDLVGTRSWAECVERVRQYLADHPEVAVVRGRGWDQNDWTLGEWPTSAELDALSDKAIVLSRIDGHPVGGFQTDEALTLDQTILGMTRDAARASFREGQAGEIRVGNWADFTIFDTNLSEIEPMNLPKTQALQVWIHGERRK